MSWSLATEAFVAPPWHTAGGVLVVPVPGQRNRSTGRVSDQTGYAVRLVTAKLAPPFADTDSRMSLLQVVLTPVYRLVPAAEKPAGVHPVVSLELRLMYEP